MDASRPCSAPESGKQACNVDCEKNSHESGDCKPSCNSRKEVVDTMLATITRFVTGVHSVLKVCRLTRYIDTYLATSRPPWPSKTPKTLHLLSTFNAARCASSCNYTQVSTSDLAHVQIIRGCKCVHATDKAVQPSFGGHR